MGGRPFRRWQKRKHPGARIVWGSPMRFHAAIGIDQHPDFRSLATELRPIGSGRELDWFDGKNAGEIEHHKHPLIWRDCHLDARIHGQCNSIAYRFRRAPSAFASDHPWRRPQRYRLLIVQLMRPEF